MLLGGRQHTSAIWTSWNLPQEPCDKQSKKSEALHIGLQGCCWRDGRLSRVVALGITTVVLPRLSKRFPLSSLETNKEEDVIKQRPINSPVEFSHVLEVPGLAILHLFWRRQSIITHIRVCKIKNKYSLMVPLVNSKWIAGNHLESVGCGMMILWWLIKGTNKPLLLLNKVERNSERQSANMLAKYCNFFCQSRLTRDVSRVMSLKFK